jgi:hypothetical protein
MGIRSCPKGFLSCPVHKHERSSGKKRRETCAYLSREQARGALLVVLIHEKLLCFCTRGWVSERTHAWITHHRRLSRDVEGTDTGSEAFTSLAMSTRMADWLAHAHPSMVAFCTHSEAVWEGSPFLCPCVHAKASTRKEPEHLATSREATGENSGHGRPWHGKAHRTMRAS